jgi:Zn-dependent protease
MTPMHTTQEMKIVGEVFGTPVVVKGWSWLPWIEVGAWSVMTWMAGKDHPERSWPARLGIGGLTTIAMLGSEWGHNLAHAAAAAMVGKKMDALRVMGGMPLVIYHNINDPMVTPSQHIARALGGPLFNAALLPLAWFLRRRTRPGSAAHEAAKAAAGMNLLLATISLLPIPGIDGGPILKWSLVNRGRTVAEADEMVKKLDRVVAVGLGTAAVVAVKRRRRLIGVILGLLAAAALGVGFGRIKEK